MKKYIRLTSAAIVLAAAFTVSFTSCKKEDEDEGNLPNISFQTTAGFTSANDTVAQNTAVMIGVNASKAEENDPLTKLTLKRSYDGGADSVIFTQDLSGASGNAISHDDNITTRSQAGTEKYTYTVVNKDGLINSVSLTLTVQ